MNFTKQVNVLYKACAFFLMGTDVLYFLIPFNWIFAPMLNTSKISVLNCKLVKIGIVNRRTCTSRTIHVSKDLQDQFIWFVVSPQKTLSIICHLQS